MVIDWVIDGQSGVGMSGALRYIQATHVIAGSRLELPFDELQLF